MDIWKDVKIDPELRQFIVLSPRDIQHYTAVALKHPDPAANLSEFLNAHGRAKRDIIQAQNKKRMEEDLAFFRNFDKWPGHTCAVKEQPWVKANGRRFGIACRTNFENDRWIVDPDGEEPEVYSSLEELVKTWSVD